MRSREDWNRRQENPDRRDHRGGPDEGRYRGRESYEQQYRSGEGGMSDMWDRPSYPRPQQGGSREAYGDNWDQRYRDSQRYGDDYDRGRPERRMQGGGMSLDEGRFVTRNAFGTQGQPRRTGNAPKGYTRSDERIREDVCDRLSDRWDVDSREIEVAVEKGEVTLRGSVPERSMKFRAESICDSVSGVNEVHNQLRVPPQRR
jgi:hypothetical protein